jgi:predicted component of type VI protein secretion system
MSNMATLITNNPDIAANARRPSDALWPQLSESQRVHLFDWLDANPLVDPQSLFLSDS